MPAEAAFAPERAEFYQGAPDAVFRRLRAEDPLHWYEPGRFWAVTRHADVQTISQRPRLFSSERGTQLFEVMRLAQGQTALGPMAEHLENSARTIIQLDPPRHTRLRKLVTGAFTPRSVAALEPRVRELARRSLDALDPSAPIDFVEGVAVPLPMFVIAELLGVGAGDYADFRRWSDASVAAGAGELGPEIFASVGELIQYVMSVAADRRRRPREDVVSALVEAEIDGERLSEAEIGMFCLTLLVAGNETTRNLVSGGALALMRDGVQRDKLLADPSLLPNAVEEMLRWVSPVRNFVRCATQDTELRGQSVRAGEYLVLFYGSANRDESVFGDDADLFDVTRANASRHLAFGFGEHLCLGAALARLEARVLFEELLARFPSFELAGEPLPLVSNLMNGLASLPVKLDP